MDKPTAAGLEKRVAGHRFFFLLLLASLSSGFLSATTVVPISDSQLFARADVVVHGIVISSSVEGNGKKHVETITAIRPLEILKGTLSGDLILHQVGGKSSDGRISKIWGSPEYAVGEEVIVYAIARKEGDYQTAELFLGKVEVKKDSKGVAFAVPALATEKQNPEIVVLAREMRSGPDRDPDDLSDPAAPRELEGYLRSLRSEGTLPVPVGLPEGTLEPVLHPGYAQKGAAPLWANFNGLFRWNNAATAVFTLDGQANITGGGTAEAANAAATWNNEPNSAINYSIGASSANLVHMDAVTSPCGWSECYPATGGVIGCSSISAGGTNVWEGETYSTLAGGEVWLRSYCSFDLYDSATTQAILTHELGHTLGLGHSDENASPHDVCRGDEDLAQMRSTVQTFAQLGTDDSDAVRWLYGDGGNSCNSGYTLTVTKTGTGGGSVTSAPAWISCGSACSGFFATGTVVTLSAVADSKSAFAGWSGDPDCSDGSVRMDAAKTCTANFVLAPDLVVSALTVSTTGKTGLTISVTDTTLAQTGYNSAAASVTRFYLSSDATLDASDVLLGSRNAPALSPGGSSSATTVLTIPLGTAPGTYSLIAKADADGLIAETNETNNTRSGTIAISGPDLIVSALTVPTSVAAGASFTVSATTMNQGIGSTGSSMTAFYLSTDATLGSGDIFLGSVAVGPLAYRATLALSTTLTMPSSMLPGSYTIIAKADDGGVVPESLETNNTKSGATAVPGPDLIVYALTVPTSVGAGASVTVIHTTKNQGTLPAPASTTAFYLSTDATLGAGDVFLGSAAVGPLAASGTLALSTTLTMPPSTLPGSYSIIAKADDGGAVAETLETNNTKSGTTAVPGPDLIMYALTVPTYGGAGLPITVTHTTKNQGTLPADVSTTAFYLSTDSTLGNSDVFLGSVAVGPLAASGTLPLSTTLTIPASTAPGSYYIVAKADDGGVVAETVETNNTKAALIKMSPDLIISSWTTPTAAVAGAAISVTDITKNQGYGTAGATMTSFYLSTNATFDAGVDVFLGSRSVPVLAYAATSTATTSLTIPSGTTPGAYYLIARADDGNAVAETLQTNNNKSSTKTITISP